MENEILYILKVLRLVPMLKKYTQYIQEKFPISVYVKSYESPFMDFAFRHKENMKGVVILMEKLLEDDYTKVPLVSVLRSLTADSLTELYLFSFVVAPLSGEQTTLENELSCLRLEFLNTVEEMKITEGIGSGEKLVIKSRKEIHSSSYENLLSKFVLTGGMLSERKKYNHLKEKYPEEIQTTLAKRCFLLNKLFTQYYHYNREGAEMGRCISEEEFGYFCDAIDMSISVFLISIEYIKSYFPEDFSNNIYEFLSEYRDARRDEWKNKLLDRY